jgi:hypothetical protein
MRRESSRVSSRSASVESPVATASSAGSAMHAAGIVGCSTVRESCAAAGWPNDRAQHATAIWRERLRNGTRPDCSGVTTRRLDDAESPCQTTGRRTRAVRNGVRRPAVLGARDVHIAAMPHDSSTSTAAFQ